MFATAFRTAAWPKILRSWFRMKVAVEMLSRHLKVKTAPMLYFCALFFNVTLARLICCPHFCSCSHEILILASLNRTFTLLRVKCQNQSCLPWNINISIPYKVIFKAHYLMHIHWTFDEMSFCHPFSHLFVVKSKNGTFQHLKPVGINELPPFMESASYADTGLCCSFLLKLKWIIGNRFQWTDCFL